MDALSVRLSELASGLADRFLPGDEISYGELKRTLAEREETIVRLEQARQQQEEWYQQQHDEMSQLQELVQEAQYISSLGGWREQQALKRAAAAQVTRHAREEAARLADEAAREMAAVAEAEAKAAAEAAAVAAAEAETEARVRLAIEQEANQKEQQSRLAAATRLQSAYRGRASRHMLHQWRATLDAAWAKRASLAAEMRLRQRQVEEIRERAMSFSPRRSSGERVTQPLRRQSWEEAEVQAVAVAVGSLPASPMPEREAETTEMVETEAAVLRDLALGRSRPTPYSAPRVAEAETEDKEGQQAEVAVVEVGATAVGAAAVEAEVAAEADSRPDHAQIMAEAEARAKAEAAGRSGIGFSSSPPSSSCAWLFSHDGICFKSPGGEGGGWDPCIPLQTFV